jgi:hypothetical protein
MARIFLLLLIETRNPPDLPDKKTPFAELVKSATNPPELKTHQKYFLPARQLSNPPELSKSGEENCHLATLTQ